MESSGAHLDRLKTAAGWPCAELRCVTIVRGRTGLRGPVSVSAAVKLSVVACEIGYLKLSRRRRPALGGARQGGGAKVERPAGRTTLAPPALLCSALPGTSVGVSVTYTWDGVRGSGIWKARGWG